jgi:NADH/F420H2 dehydrogenase subunit C
MAVAPRAGEPEAPSLLAYDRDHLNDLSAQLERLDGLTGQSVPKRIMRGGIVAIEAPAADWLDVSRALRDEIGFEMLTSVSGVDMIDHMEALYHFRSLQKNWLLQARVKVPNEAPQIVSLVSLYPSANWLERETYDLFGITFLGHPDLRRILLDDEFEGYPLRKDFRSTPVVVHDRATTQAHPAEAIAGAQVRNQERVVIKRLGQGNQERVHPGIATLGSEAVFLETGQGVGTDANAMHGYVVDEQYLGPATKPQEE